MFVSLLILWGFCCFCFACWFFNGVWAVCLFDFAPLKENFVLQVTFIFCFACFALVFCIVFCFVFFLVHFIQIAWLKDVLQVTYLLFCLFVCLFPIGFCFASLLSFVIFIFCFLKVKENVFYWRFLCEEERCLILVCPLNDSNVKERLKTFPLRRRRHTHWRCLFSSCPVSPTKEADKQSRVSNIWSNILTCTSCKVMGGDKLHFYFCVLWCPLRFSSSPNINCGLLLQTYLHYML